MTVADLKIACLKALNASYEELTATNIADYYGDENLSPYLYAMPESINRCFDRLSMDQVSPKVKVLESTLTHTHDTNTYYTIIDLTQITDYDRLDRVTYMSALGEYTGNCPFILEEDTLYLDYEVDGVYTLIYYKELPYLTSTTLDTATLDVPDKLLRLIPYFVKSELYEEDQPQLAVHARNLFEAGLSALKTKAETRQTGIVELFTFED